MNPAASGALSSAGGQTEIVRMLLELPLERAANEALRMASERGHTEIVSLLRDLQLERGV